MTRPARLSPDTPLRPAAAVWDSLRCRHGGPKHHARAPVVAIVSVPQGCVCWPDPVQALCRQHLDRLQDGGSIPVTIVAHRIEDEEGEPMDGIFKLSEADHGYDELELVFRGDHATITIEEPWAGDTETGFGRSSSFTIAPADALALAEALTAWAAPRAQGRRINPGDDHRKPDRGG